MGVVCPTMRTLLLALFLWAFNPLDAAAQSPGHRLPEGEDRPYREHEVDVLHLDLALRFDMGAGTVDGQATVRLRPLREKLAALSFDAAGLEVSSVRVNGAVAPHSSKDRKLRVELAAPLPVAQDASVQIAWRTKPVSGFTFVPARGGRPAMAWNYGEGGLHYGFLPLDNDMNDRFTVAAALTVAKPFSALSNGAFRGVTENTDGTRTFRWQQAEPIPNYLLAFKVGELVRVPQPDAQVGGRRVPVAGWGPPGREREVAVAFAGAERMVEFFSRRFGKAYPWAKYEQVALSDFEGAMETTTLVGYALSQLRSDPQLPDGTGPSFGEAYPAWTYEDVVAHELAHHWFGDLVTARSLGSLFLNESFATFAHTIWTAEAHGEADADYQRWRLLRRYLDHVAGTGEVRPLEYERYRAPGDAYQEETTYFKGALVLHQLRFLVGDEGFYRALTDYLERNAFGFTDAHELEESFARATGRNLRAYFEDWITGGGGHPVLEVSHHWSAERKELDLTVRQIHADLPFENDFRLPVDVEIATASGSRVHRIELTGWSTSVALPAAERPTRVVFDTGGHLVADVQHARSLAEVLDQLHHGRATADRLRAVHQLGDDFPRRGEAALLALAGDPAAHWGLRQEAALALGRSCADAAPAALLGALRDADRRLRRAAALALADGCGGADADADAALAQVAEDDAAEDVAAVAARSLGLRHAAGAREVLGRLLRRDSQWWDARRLGALLGLAELEDPALAPSYEPLTRPGHTRQVKNAAVDAWRRAAPGDPALATRLRELVKDPNRFVRLHALETLGTLHRAEDAAWLRAFAEADTDPTQQVVARDAAEAIEAFTKKPEVPSAAR
jgi:aminopeptidase N